MTENHGRVVDHPSAWKAGDFRSRDDIAFDLGERHLDAFEAALATVRARGLRLDDITRETFPLDGIADDIAAVRDEIGGGRGIVLVRGWPVDRYGVDDMGLIYFGFGVHLGVPASQSVMGDRLGHVIGVGGKDRRERAYRNSVELMPHTDAADIIGLLALCKAREGGVSGFVSSLAIYNEILATRPELLAPLRRGFRRHRFGEEAPGEPPVTPWRVPVFSVRDGVMSCSYLRVYYEMAARELGEPLTGLEVAALDCMDEIATRPDMRLNMMLEPGEAALFNNYTVLHSRTAFEDHDDPALRRHLLRLWLACPGLRPLVDVLQRDEETAGIAAQKGETTYYTGDAREGVEPLPGPAPSPEGPVG